MTLAQKTKKQLLATQVALKRRQNNEAQLEKELGRFFKKLKKEVLKGLDEYWSDYQLLQGQVNLMLSPVHEAHKEYYEIIRKYKLREYRLGKAEAKRLTKQANKDKVALKAVTTLGIQGFVDKDKSALFGTIPKAEEDLLNRTFRTSQNTLNRVDSQLNQIISDGYREGKGINQVANDITQRFDQLADWEARRIARTEINTSHNQATRDQYREDGVEYTQWIAANDNLTRDSHAEVDGEIIPIDGKYSNGLEYPGDMSGPIEEWINCRCGIAPFVVPYGFMAPSFSPFRESDLVPINMESLGEPSQEQLDANLSPEQRSQYEQYTKAVEEAQSIIDSKFSLPRERLQARTQLEYNLSRLNQLKLVANGELARGYQGIIGAVASQPETPQDQQEVETHETYQINGGERYSNVEITQDVLDKIIQHQEKRATAKIEWGNTVNLKTGKLNLANDVKGKKGQVSIPRPDTGQYGVLHNHPSEAPFSGGDMFNQLGYRNQGLCVATTPNGVWLARDTEFGATSKLEYGVPENTRYEIMYKMDEKYREFSRETLDKKYSERMRNATSRKEYNAIKKEYLADPEYKEKYGKWLLDEYGVGKNKYNHFEIEFISKEELQNVRF